MPNQEQAVATQQQNVAVQAAAAFNPLNGVHLTNELQPYAGALAAPYDQFVAAFDSIEEGRKVWNREIGFVVMALTSEKGAALRRCLMTKPLELINAVKTIGISGLSLNPALKQGYLYDFKGCVTFVPSYTGLADILTRTGLVSKIDANLVYKNDFFEIEYGGNEHLTHKPNPFGGSRTDNDIIGGYWYATLPDGTRKFGTMDIAEIRKVQNASPAGKSGPWVSWFTEMAKKTLVRRAFKNLPHVGISDNNLKVIETVMKADDTLFFDPNEQKKNTSYHSNFEEVEEVPSEPVQQTAPTPQPDAPQPVDIPQ
ncbi:MAG: recombinase RecT [Paludibacteraceae bacterium]|nr:recombinase RecT [Paludibacteraceae bacterium]